MTPVGRACEPERRRLILRTLTAILLLSLPIQAADSRKDLERRLKKQLENRTIVLREPYSGEKLHFDAKGSLLDPVQPGGWAGDGYLRVRTVRVRGNSLNVNCARLVGFYDRDGSWRLTYQGHDLSLDVELPSGEPAEAEVQETLGKIFRDSASVPSQRPPPNASSFRHERYEFRGGDRLLFRVRGAPDWQPLGEISEAVAVDELENGQKVYVNTKALQRPRPIETPDPSYSEEARRKREQGTVKFRVLVNAAGRIHSLRVESSDSQEFAIQGAKAISRWKFDPAKLEGRPVAVILDVDMNFRLYP